MFRQGQAIPAEGEPENPEPEPTSFVDQTPTPTSMEVSLYPVLSSVLSQC